MIVLMNCQTKLRIKHLTAVKSDAILERKILATHSHASRPIGNQHRSYTPPHIHQLIQHRNRLRKQYHRTLSPAHKTELNRAQQLVKNTLKQYSTDSWNQRLSALNTQDNSLWHTQKLFKNKRQAIPPLECDRGTAITDTQKANLLADTLKDNFTENTYHNRHRHGQPY
ncbi:hypothetical protein TNCV_927411 [Trichonephila clavipes]|nr:hypothetical protein TNCV_927411 [Trichonephila clavipes]